MDKFFIGGYVGIPIVIRRHLSKAKKMEDAEALLKIPDEVAAPGN